MVIMIDYNERKEVWDLMQGHMVDNGTDTDGKTDMGAGKSKIWCEGKSTPLPKQSRIFSQRN